MIKLDKTIKAKDLQLNEGQLGWLPRNPRSWTRQDLDRMKASLQEDPDFLNDRPALVVALPGSKGKYVAFAGNLRSCAAQELDKGMDVPCIVYAPENEDDCETIRRRAMKDNGTFGSWDWDILANEWPEDKLEGWGVPAWKQPGSDAQRQMENGGLSSEGREGAEGYDEFLDKFEQKLTTDDCYTPAVVYDIVRDFVDEKVASLEGRKIVRPFYPGGNYEDLKQYPKGCVVLDNPPFSLYSKIVRFYVENGIDFFLFGPSLTLFVSNADVCFVVANIPIVYENGAVVSTGFVTNMAPGLRIWVEGTMRERVIEAQKSANEQGVYELPEVVVTSARLGKIAARNVELKVKSEDCIYIHDLDGMKEIGKGLYGGGVPA